MYNWRKLTKESQEELLELRKIQHNPWHSPPHKSGSGTRYHITGACFEHQPIIGLSPERMREFENSLISTISEDCDKIHAWVVLPNHYHILLRTNNILQILKQLGKTHGRTSFQWNGEENRRGRQVWCNALETAIKSDNHFCSTRNYIHNNPVRHKYVLKWGDWPFSSAADYLNEYGHKKAVEIWNEYPITGYGDGWDDPDM